MPLGNKRLVISDIFRGRNDGSVIVAEKKSTWHERIYNLNIMKSSLICYVYIHFLVIHSLELKRCLWTVVNAN